MAVHVYTEVEHVNCWNVHVDTGVGTRRWPIVVPMFEQEAFAFFLSLTIGTDF